MLDCFELRRGRPRFKYIKTLLYQEGWCAIPKRIKTAKPQKKPLPKETAFIKNFLLF